MNHRVGLIVIICGAGLAAGFALRASFSPSGSIAIYPSDVQFREARVQGEPIEVQFVLRNESNQPLTVTSLSTSCGCMVLSGASGSVNPPFRIEVGATYPISLSIATNGRTGNQSFSLSVVAESSRGDALASQAVVRATIQSGLRAEPSLVAFRRVKPGSMNTATIKLVDRMALPELAS